MDWQRMLDGIKKHESILLVCVDVDEMMVHIDVNQMFSTLSEDELVRANNFHDPLLRAVSYTHLTLPTTPYV